ncbi:MAG: ribosomal L7Ae/L30e/S12e/Gadd45 family protein [Candidatus Cloacimonadaceae bacterium]
MAPAKKHHIFPPIEPEIDKEQKILTLIQFSRKAGKLVNGFEACKKEILNGKVRLLILTQDVADNTKDKIMKFVTETGIAVPTHQFGTQKELSAALGLPWTAVFGILDKNFASKIVSYIEQ